MNRLKLTYSILLGLLCPLVVMADNYVIINQVMYDTPLNEKVNISPYSNGEFIELYNGSEETVSLQGWYLRGESPTEHFDFPAISVPSKGYLLIAFRHADTPSFVPEDLFASLEDANIQIIYQNKVVLANQGETIALYNNNHEVADQITYDGTSHLTKPDRLSADNDDDIDGDQCISLHRTWVEFDEKGLVVPGTSQWKTAPISFAGCQLADTAFGEHYLTGNQPLPTGENYIMSVSPLDPATRISISENGVSVSNGVRTRTSVQYYDGLGRPNEQIAIEATPNKQDLVQTTSYTGLHRVTKQWLPVVRKTEGAYIDISTIQSENSNNRPFTETLYENSALDRVIGEKLPGANYASHPSSKTYAFNGEATIRNYEIVRDSVLKTSGFYEENSLFKTTVADEDGVAVTTYTDKLGNKIAEERAGNMTYYVYDNLMRLRYVLPHISSCKLADGEYAPSNLTLRAAAYYYKYDSRGNMIYKRLPGCEPIYMVYDQLGQLALTQDGNQRDNHSWTMCAYDSIGRQLYTAEIILSQSHADLITFFANKWQVEHYGHNYSYPLTGTGYASRLLGNANIRLLTINYYDDYNFINILPTAARQPLRFIQKSGYGLKHDDATGMLTGTRIYNLSEDGYTATSYFYDSKGRVVQQRSVRINDSYKTTTSTEYLFDGSVAQQLKEQGTDDDLVDEHYRYEYDHAGRTKKVYYQLNNDAEIILSEFSYDEQGRLAQSLLHDSKDTTRYSYDIRNMLTEAQNTHFSEKLFYADNISQFAAVSPCYNGNISVSQTAWGNTANTFTYTYDAMNRLTESEQLQDNQRLPSEWFLYDPSGNILQLQRYSGKKLIDDLRFSYQEDGNQLQSISDDGEDADMYSTIEYHNAEIQADTTMYYDANGNLIKDLDRGINAISYNVLNLPDTVLFGNGNQIVNFYDASGKKYKSIIYTNLATASTPSYDIAHCSFATDSVEYRVTDYNGNLETYYTPHDTTRRVFNAIGYYSDSTYYHYIKDHLGNICVVVNSATDSVVQRTLYYASGVPMAESLGRDQQPYLYNGKEFIEAHGLNEYDSQARRYYATIMRTTTMDPLAENYYHISPYAWCGNNPIKYIDPDGRDIRWESKREGKIYQQYKKKVNSRERRAAKEVASLNKKLQKNPKNRASLLAKLIKAEQKLTTYQQIQCELVTMEGSEVIFIIRTSKGEWGATTQNPENKSVNINITSDDNQAITSVAHELCHGYQYLDGRLDFSEDGEGGGPLYDQTDEIEAYKRQSLFEPSLEGMSDEEINSVINKIISRDEYKDLPVGPFPALIDVHPQILIYNPDDERKPR